MEKDKRINLDGSLTSYPTGEEFVFGEGKFRIPVRLQTLEYTCGQACLEMLGHPLDDLVVEKGAGVTTMDVAFLVGTDDVLDSIKDEGYRFTTPHMVVGVKKETGNPHWFIAVEDKVICPEKGIMDARQYFDTVVGEIKAAMPIPFPGPLSGK